MSDNKNEPASRKETREDILETGSITTKMVASMAHVLNLGLARVTINRSVSACSVLAWAFLRSKN